MELLTWLSRTSHQIIAATICSCCNHQSILKSASILHVTSFGWKCRVELCHPPPPSLGHQCDHTWFSVSVLAVTGADPPWDEGQRLFAWAQRQLHGHLKQEVQINLSSWNYRGNLGRQNAISQDTEVNTVNLVESAMGPLITATGQGLSFMSHPKDGTSQWALGLLWLEEESSATYCNTVTSPNTWAHLEGVTSFLDHLKNQNTSFFFIIFIHICFVPPQNPSCLLGCLTLASRVVFLGDGQALPLRADLLSHWVWGWGQPAFFLTNLYHFCLSFLTGSSWILCRANCHWLEKLVRCLHKGFYPFNY